MPPAPYSVDELRELYATVAMAITAILDGNGTPHDPTAADEEIFAVARNM